MFALVAHRATLCPICGGPLADCGPSTAGKWNIPPPRRCQRTEALLLAQESRTKTQRPQALMWRAERR